MSATTCSSDVGEYVGNIDVAVVYLYGYSSVASAEYSEAKCSGASEVKSEYSVNSYVVSEV